MYAFLVAVENLTPWMPLAFVEAIPAIASLAFPERQRDAVIEARPLSLNLNYVTCQLFKLAPLLASVTKLLE